MFKKVIASFVAISLLVVSGCTKIEPVDVSKYQNNEDTISVPTFTKEKIEEKTPTYVPYSKFRQAEDGELSGKAKVGKTISNFTGTGYVNYISTKKGSEGNVTIVFPTENKQYYNISVYIYSAKSTNCDVLVNDKTVASFITTGNKGFEKIEFKNIYLSNATTNISFEVPDGAIAVDRVLLKASDEISKLEFNSKKLDNLSNEKASGNAKDVYGYLKENFGKKIISGQYASVGTNDELDLIYKTTGQNPVIRFGDLMSYTDSTVDSNEIEMAIEWAKKGGIVGYMWHWAAPVDKNPAYYAEDTSFKLSKAVTTQNIATMSLSDIESLKDSGKVSAECVEIIKDIDTISKQLLVLKNKGIAVLWRPLNDASRTENSFWWGSSGIKAYKWLWNLLYERQTKYYGLNNLIWVWSAQSQNWYVGDDKCDILAADVYDGGSKASQINFMLSLKEISSKKLIALSECSNAPGLENMFRDKAYWSYFGVWSGDYIIDEQKQLVETYTSKDELIRLYNNDKVVVLDEYKLR